MGNEAAVGEADVGKAPPAPKDGAKRPKKKRSSGKGGKGTAVEADRPLPEAYRQLLDLFTATDHAYCFLVKNSIPPRVSSLQSMVWRLFPGRFGDEGSFLPRLQRLADVARSVLVLDEPPAGELDGEFEPREVQTEAQRLELFFPQKNTGGTGKAKVSKRQLLVRQALLKHAEGKRTDDDANASGNVGGSGGGDGGDIAGGEGNARTAAKEKEGLLSSDARSPSGGGGDSGEGSFSPGGGGKRPGRLRGDGRGNGRGVANVEKGEGSDSESAKAAVSKTRANSGRSVVGRGGASNATTGQSGRPPATGTALLLSDPLSQSPAYVAYGRDEGVDVGETDEDGQQAGSSAKEQALPGHRGGAGGRAKGKGKRRAAPDAKEGDDSRLRFDPLLALDHLKSLPIYEGQAVYTETFPGREGEYAETAHPLHPEVAAALAASKGVTRLFKHQALAIDAAVAGQHVALSTATSSGKSVVFNVSVIEAILGTRPDAVALYLFPTKALAQDQLRSLKGLVGASAYLSQRVRPMTLDGDTPFRERGVVAEEANIILTNPDMLHASVLPGHKRFRRILANLSHVVIDEAHVYRGAFGAHVSMVLRRLLRLWSVNAHPGPPPQFICCSATMRAAPSHFASLLPLEECLGGRRNLYFGSTDTAPTGRKTVVLWRPPIVAEWFKPPEAASGKVSSGAALRRGRSGGATTAARVATASPTTAARPRRGRKGAAHAVSPATADPLDEAGVVASTATGERPKPDASTSATATTEGRAGGGGGAGGRCLSGMTSLRGLDAWRKGPTDNFYNKEYMKLMGAELPGRSSGKEAVSPEGGAVNAKTPRRAAPMASSAVKETSEAGAEDGGTGSTRHRPVDSGDLPRLGLGDDETGCNSERAPATARVTKRATRGSGSPGASVESVGVGARGGYAEGLQTEALNSNPVALEAGMKGVVEVAALEGAEARGGACVVTATEPTKEDGSAGEGEGERQEKDEPGWEDGRRRSPICETAQILAGLVKQRIRTLAFCRTRKLTELTLRYGLQDLEKTAPHMVSLVQGYRGGYTKDERRKIEERLFANKLLGVTATCALELGVDIGELDVTLHLGFPGSVSSLRQQAGRAGRGGTDSLAIMVIFQDPISQFFVRNPRELFHKEPEAAVLDSMNELVLRAHVLCAAAECPLGVPSLGDVTDAALFGGKERLQEVINMLTGGDFPRLVRATGNLGWKSNPGLDPPPCRRVGLRMIDPVSFSVVDDIKGGEPYDTVEYSRAFFSLFEGAIYLHQARQYLVTKLDLARHVAHTIPVKVNYYTAARNNVDVNVTKRLEVSEDNHAHTGCVDIICTVYGFAKKQLGTGRTIERGECTLPPLQYATRAFWLDVGVTAKRTVEEEGCDFEGGVHAVGHALLAVVPLFLLCDAEDVDCEHARPHHDRPQPQRILVYDKRPGGVGVSDAMFGCHRAVMSKALELVEGCPCPDGCLACIHDHGCTGYNSIIDKRAALIILRRLIEDMMEAGQAATDARRVVEEEGDTPTSQQRWRRRRRDQADDEDSAKSSGGFFLDQGSSEADPDASVDGGCRTGTTSEGDTQLEVDTQQEGGGGSRGVGADDDLIASPRKRQRLRNLRFAKGMDRARENDIAVVRRWIPSVP